VIRNLAAEDVAERLRGEDPPMLLDVREPWEEKLASLPGATLIPMGDLAAHLGDLPRDSDVVVMCHHGNRSAMVVQWLNSQGFDRVANLEGGIDAWSKTVDPSVPLY
jgi:rhodanese-related sulfurtransferase